MIISRNFFHPDAPKTSSAAPAGTSTRQDQQGRIHVALFTELFSRAAEMPLWSNNMYANLKSDIEASIQLIRTREKVVMDIYEPSETDDLDRERALIGFRKYMNDCCLGSRKQNTAHLTAFSVFLLIGITIILLLYAVEMAWMPSWLFTLIDTIAAVFIWQFVGYMAFEYPAERKALRRIRQMIALEYEFHHWD